MPALALRQIPERSCHSRLKLRANCSANDVARFRSAICDKNVRLPKSLAHPTDPHRTFAGSDSQWQVTESSGLRVQLLSDSTLGRSGRSRLQPNKSV